MKLMNTKTNTKSSDNVKPQDTLAAKDRLKLIRSGVLADYQTRSKLR